MKPLIRRILAKLKREELDVLLVCSAANISYLTSYTSRDSYLLISEKENLYLTDSRYIEEAKNNLKGCFVVKKIGGSIFKLLADTCKKIKAKSIGFEEEYLSFARYRKLKQELSTNIDLVPINGWVEELRQIKTPQELEKIKKAIQINVAALNFIRKYIIPGKKEIELAAELQYFIRYNGASNSAFDIIVASGPNSSFPHHITSQRAIQKNEPVLIDLGVDYLGYKSDLTRVFFSGKINSLIGRVYDIVKEAQKRALAKIRPAVNIGKIDTAARQYISKKGYGGFFGHRLGHGVGLEVHEMPYISQKDNGLLKPGMVFTVEPAIYLPHKFGIRLEDMVVVTEKGVKLLSGSLDK